MIWIIGDIHGSHHKLKKLIGHITSQAGAAQADGRGIDKFIFIGDYIDRGPGSRETIDIILELAYEKIFLCGNHEDMMLNFVENGRELATYGRTWLLKNNGGRETIRSFMPGKFGPDCPGMDFEPEMLEIDKKYIDFLNALKFSHSETIGGHDFLFTHAGLGRNELVEEQTAIKNRREFHDRIHSTGSDITDTMLWTRHEPSGKFGKFILVHGHTPTVILERVFTRLNGYETTSLVPFCCFADPLVRFVREGDNLIRWENASLDKLISINVDTGAVFGAALSAIGLSAETLEKGIIPFVNTVGRDAEDDDPAVFEGTIKLG